MKSSKFLKVSSLLAAFAIISGCSCSTNCYRGEPMARPAIALRDVHFAFDSAQLTPTAKITLQEDYAGLFEDSTLSSAKIVLEGRADERGESAYNKTLSAKRAAAVKNYLVKLGASEDQFETTGLGDEFPLARGSTPSSWAKNRSVRVLVR